MYVFPPTGEVLHYRLYVPSRYNGTRSLPLVVVLHGYMGNENSAFDETPRGLRDSVQQEAERHGFIVASPAGYDGRGDYGAHLALPVHKGMHIVQSRREDNLANADVLDVIRRVEADYRIDRRRVYLMGNSMGMTGTLYLAQKFPTMWCAIAPSDGPPWPGYPVERLHSLSGAIFVNGGLDRIAPADVNRKLAARVRATGIDTRFVEVPYGTHASAWYFALPQIFDFFAAHTCGQAGRHGAAASSERIGVRQAGAAPH
jgi:predicted peptidase